MIDFKSLRIKAGLTQSQMADTLGIKQPAYSKLENGGWNASSDTEARYLEYISEKLPNIDVNEFKRPAGVSVNNIRSRLRDVKVSSIDERTIDLMNVQSKQMAELIDIIKKQQDLILSLSKNAL